MRIRPGFEVYWRRPGESQVGVDPRCALLLADLDEAEQQLLDRLPGAVSAEELRWRGRELLLSEERISALLGRLIRAGYLIEDEETSAGHADPSGDGAIPPEVLQFDASTTYWHRAAVAGKHRLSDRGEAVVHVCGLGELGLRLACILAQAGVGTVSLRDRRRVRRDDVGGGLYRAGDVGSVREETALSVLRSIQPMVHTRMSAGSRPELVVLVDAGVMDPISARTLLREDIPHLPVLIRELDTLIGPMVRPGLGVCLRCLDLHRCEKDPRWPAIATQVASRPLPGVETSQAWLAAAFAAHQVLAVVDGRPTVLEGTSAEISGWDPVPLLRRWQPHPECGCSPATFEAPSLGTTSAQPGPASPVAEAGPISSAAKAGPASPATEAASQ